jgi:hypothetical protein
VLAGLLAAGILAPFTLLLPEAWQREWQLFAIAVVCLLVALLVGRPRRTPPAPPARR